MRNLDIVVISLDDSAMAVATKRFDDIPFTQALDDQSTTIRFYKGELDRLLKTSSFDAIITPGNSYGHMTGGFDGALVDYFGNYVDGIVRRHIEEVWGGELPVGNARLFQMQPDQGMDNLVYAPTMRVPMTLPDNSDAAYVATRAAFQQINRFNKRFPMLSIETILLPVMGMGTGRLPLDTVVRQMQLAIVNSIQPRFVKDLFNDGLAQHALITKR